MSERNTLQEENRLLREQTEAAYTEHQVAVETLRKSRDSQMALDRAVQTLQVKVE